MLADSSVAGLSPEGWARKVAEAAEAWGADRVVAEANNGGAMVAAVLAGADVAAAGHAGPRRRGQGRAGGAGGGLVRERTGMFAGRFPALEDELCGLTWDGKYYGPGRSPDRADAMVWALTDLMLGRRSETPRVRAL